MRQAEQVVESEEDGIFANSCLVHCQTLKDIRWATYSIYGKPMREIFGNWYFGRSGESKSVDCEYGCNPSCTNDNNIDSDEA